MLERKKEKEEEEDDEGGGKDRRVISRENREGETSFSLLSSSLIAL